ncbi:fibronectin type III domain-containing protein [Dysgonomonas sp. 520]|uniref:fibronectin type III domain-containing protein n=1 Tax=Dysgonomonas sp. 520 TaxID=2302931 RepID=UPI0013D5993A|nr:fibronectin type III domain-containing protein [Dysgonomonas sp. 520]
MKTVLSKHPRLLNKTQINTNKKNITMKKILLTGLTLFLGMTAVNAQLIKNDFLDGYSIGDNLEKGEYTSTTNDQETNPVMIQWNLTGKSNSSGKNDNRAGNSPLITDILSYPGYIETDQLSFELLKLNSGEGRTTGYSLTSDNTYKDATYYVSFLVNFSNAGASTPTDFLALEGNYYLNTQRAKICIIKSGGGFKFALLESNGTAAESTDVYQLNTTYLLVLKYEFNGKVQLFVEPAINTTEPTSTPLEYTISSGVNSIRGITVRQRSNFAAKIGGLRFAQTWNDVLGLVETPAISEATAITTDGFTANWTPVVNATNYKVTVYQGSTPVGTHETTEGQDASSLTITGLEELTQYTYTVTALNETNNYFNSDESVESDPFTTNATNSIDSSAADKGIIISTRYYNLNGIEVNEPSVSNVYIKQDIYEDGSITTSKTFK